MSSVLKVLKIENGPKLSRNLKLLNFKNNICWENYAKVMIFLKVSDFNKLLKKIVIPKSIRYAHQEGRTYTVEDKEVKTFIGLNLFMGYHRLAALHLYWSTNSQFNVPFDANYTNRHRFMEIRRNMHFNYKKNNYCVLIYIDIKHVRFVLCSIT